MGGDPKVTVSALARLEMAREKARIMRKRPGDASELERAAERWKEEERREAQQIYREPDASPVSFRQILLQAMDKAPPQGRRDRVEAA